MEKQKRPQTHDSEAWRLDPADVARHAQLRRRSEQRSGLGKAARYFAIALALAGGFAVYWNFDTLRNVTVQAPALSALFKSVSGSDNKSVPASGASDTAVIESSQVAGTAAPTSVSADRNRESGLEVAERATPAAPAAVEQPPAPAPAPKPLPAPTPETIAFALPKFNVSERDAFAAVIVVRNGGNRGPSVFTWWTSDGTAKAGSDYVDLGRVVEKFAAGEQNRIIRIPIVGDAVKEDTESFYVNLAPGDDASAEAQDRVEVVVEDDD